MSLAAGGGPFGKRPQGRFNVEPNPPTGSLLSTSRSGGSCDRSGSPKLRERLAARERGDRFA